MRNVKTREGYEFWDKICALKHYGFLHSADRMRVVKTEGIGNWIDMHDAQEIVDQAQEEVNDLRRQLAEYERRNSESMDVLSRVVSLHKSDYAVRGGMPFRWMSLIAEADSILCKPEEAESHDSQAIS